MSLPVMMVEVSLVWIHWAWMMMIRIFMQSQLTQVETLVECSVLETLTLVIQELRPRYFIQLTSSWYAFKIIKALSRRACKCLENISFNISSSFIFYFYILSCDVNIVWLSSCCTQHQVNNERRNALVYYVHRHEWQTLLCV